MTYKHVARFALVHMCTAHYACVLNATSGDGGGGGASTKFGSGGCESDAAMLKYDAVNHMRKM